jgi:hypothetical protein
LRRCATSRKVAVSIPDEVNFSIYLILPAAVGPMVHSASNYRSPRPVTGIALLFFYFACYLPLVLIAKICSVYIKEDMDVFHTA